MSTLEWSGTPAGIAAERAAIEAEIADSTLLTTYAGTVAAAPDAEAHRWLEDGQWRSLTYREAHEQVRDLALGLGVIGLRAGEFAVIWSRNRPEATIADYAVMHARGVPVFIYPTVSAEQAAYIAGHCDASVAIVEREFLPRLMSIRGQLPKLRQVIVIDGGSADAIGWPRLAGLGHGEAERSPGLFEQTWRQVETDDLATLIYTSGTTGQPKAVMLTHRNVRFLQLSIDRVLPREAQSDDDGSARLISYLPVAHVTARAVDHWGAMAYPITLAHCPDPRQLFQVAGQVHPTTLFAVPRVWEKLHAALRTALPDVAPAAVRALPEQVRQAVLTRIGLDRCRLASSGAAPLDPAIIEFYLALGLPFTEGWGMTELSMAATIAAPGRTRVGAVGTALPGMELRVADDGEVLVRGPLVMGGYYKDPEQTAEAVDADGWMHTGDVGEVDADGFLKITDRKKELIVTSGGKNISPALIEYELQRHPLVGQACAIGDRRNYVTALIVLDPEAAPAWAREHGIEAASPADLARRPEVLAEIERAVAAANSHLARPEQVRRFLVLPNEWTAETGELTPTLKRRRRVITDRYAAEISRLYE
ncbi:long-chain fatty acid--CoA ligase [Trebonia sp.]|uniref:AMP-dependent synthetase/ligase n=1 Tax=Trebonia sp. TaxID=2767075 RepID=UPI00260CB8D1|nr:AMP-dependent synthetase/ligase [Trebonia sp.]